MAAQTRHIFSRIQKNFTRIAKTALFSLVFLLLFFAKTTTTLAAYDNYINLFRGGQIEPALKLINLVKPTGSMGGSATVVPDIQFNFQGSFDLSVGGTNPKEWHWDHIRDFDNSSYVFMLRICDTSATDENSCLFSVVPHKSTMQNDVQMVCTNGTCVAPNPLPKIYHYVDGGSLQNDKFNVLFRVPSLAPLNQGTLGNGVDLNQMFQVGSPTTYRADIWYCAGEFSGEPLPADDSSDGIRQFKNLCGAGHPYFKIAESTQFRMPQTIQDALNQTPATVDQINTSPRVGGPLPECGVTSGDLFVGCIARLVYYLIYIPIEWFAGLMGNLFDFFLGYSLDDSSYRADFAVRGWQIVRDISNIFFIIILVWTGLSAVFNTEKTNLKRVVPMLILNALLINFSLFATRVVIDMSNIVARVFYSTIEITEKIDGVEKPKEGIVGYKPLSEKIVSSFNPQKIFSTAVLTQAETQQRVGQGNLAKSGSAQAGYFIIVSLLAALILFAIAMMFWKTAFFFLGRVIGLYIAMIFAPFAFLTKGNMPIVSNIKELSWDNWVKDLINYALLAPIFVFFLYIIYSFIQSDFIKTYQSDITSSFFETIIFIAIPMLIVYFMIDQGVKIAKTYAGKIGEMVQTYATKAAGFAGGAALGATALVGGRVVGAAASKLNESRAGSWLRDKAANNRLARVALGGLNAASAGSYDVRQTGIGKTLFKQMGVDTDQKGLNVFRGAGLGLGTDQRKGGFEADVKRRQEFQEKEAKLLEEKMSDDQIKKYNEKQKKKWSEKTDPIIEGAMEMQFGKAVVAQWKANDKKKYDDARSIVLKNANVQAEIAKVTPPREMKSTVEVNSSRREKFAKNLEMGGVVTQVLKGISEQGRVGEIASAILGATIGTAVGEGVRYSGDKKAAKKIKEKNKIEKDLVEIQKTLDKGFRDLIALEKYQDTPEFNALEQKEKEDIIKYGYIQEGSGPADRAGKHLYEILSKTDQDEIDRNVETLKRSSDKKEYERYEQMVKAMEGNRFNLKKLGEDLRDLRDKMMEDIKTNASLPQKEASRKAWVEKLEEKMRAEKHQKTWQDIGKHMDEQKKKLKGEEEKK